MKGKKNDQTWHASGSLSLDALPSLSYAYNSAVDMTQDLMSRLTATRPVSGTEFQEVIDVVYPEVLATNNVLRHLRALRRKDSYTEQHSVAVSILAIKIGQSLKMEENDVRTLGLAALLHDSGKCHIPLAILNKPDSLSAQEREVMNLHPVLGYKIVKDININDIRIERAVIQHHERNDGTGYPYNCKGDEIDLYSRIIAVADTFDALTNDRVYRSAMPIFIALDEVMQGAFGHLDPLAARNFLDYVISLSPGETVVLSTGEIGKVVLLNPSEPTRPLVMVDNRFIDLQMERDVYVKEVCF